MIEKEIKAKYNELHDMRSDAHYGKKYTIGVTVEEEAQFNIDHGKIWNDMEAELIAEGYLKPPEPARDLEAEIDKINEKLNLLLGKVNGEAI